MEKRSRTIKFKAGDLAVVRSNFKTISNYGYGPPIPGCITVQATDLAPKTAFLVLSDAKESSHAQNRKIYVEIMTEQGPRISWASAFRMRLKDE